MPTSGAAEPEMTMHLLAPRSLLCACLAPASTAALAADAFAPAGAKATLSVEYLYESSGSKRSEGMYDPYEWRVKRSANLLAELLAQPASAVPALQAFDAALTARLKSEREKGQAAAAKIAPMMASAEAIVAKCGDDEACISRETMKMGAAMQGTPQLAAVMSANKDMQELPKPGATRYQAWRATAQKGNYLIDETAHVSVTDPICTSHPRRRCTRDEIRKGSGEIPLPPDAKKNPLAITGLAAVELDAVKNTLLVGLPIPLFPLPYTETITTDEPDGTHSTPTPKGPQQKLHSFRVSASGVTNDSSINVPLKGGWRSQSGEQVVMLKGEFGDAGKLTVRWRFAAQ
jgi:hypothetical protein